MTDDYGETGGAGRDVNPVLQGDSGPRPAGATAGPGTPSTQNDDVEVVAGLHPGRNCVGVRSRSRELLHLRGADRPTCVGIPRCEPLPAITEIGCRREIITRHAHS